MLLTTAIWWMFSVLRLLTGIDGENPGGKGAVLSKMPGVFPLSS